MSGETDKLLDNWLTRGRPAVIRTRGAIKTRGTSRKATVEVKGVEEVPKLLEQLNEEVPEVPWVVVVDGRMDALAKDVCLQAKAIREGSGFALVSSEPFDASDAVHASLGIVQLNPENERDVKFLNNLIADLVVVSSEPDVTQEKRLERWLWRARFILTEKT